MKKDKFIVYDMNIDYNFLGTYPKEIDSFSNKELFNYFIDCFKTTFLSDVFFYYGDLEVIKEQMSKSSILTDTNYESKTNKQKWCILIIVILDMFYKMHNTYLAQETLKDICNNIDLFTDNELFKIINDFNFSLFFGIEESITVAPSKMLELEATTEDVFLLKELLENKIDIINKIKSQIKKSDINEESYNELCNQTVDNNYAITIYDWFADSWITMIGNPKNTFKDILNITRDEWDTTSSGINAVIVTMCYLLIPDKEKAAILANYIYSVIMNIYKKALNIKYEIGF